MIKKCGCLLNYEQAAVLRTLKSGRKSAYRINQFLQVLRFVSKKKTAISLHEVKKAIGFSYPTAWVYLRMLRSLGLIKIEAIKSEGGLFVLTSPRTFSYKLDKNLLKTVFFFILSDFRCPSLITAKKCGNIEEKAKKAILQL